MRLFNGRHRHLFGNPLVPVVQPFPPATKQALYAAANEGTLRRGTWDGCAFNRAGELLGELVSTKKQAAAVFDMPVSAVSRFISVWDQLRGSDDDCTRLLREAVETVGLFSDPTERGRGASRATARPATVEDDSASTPVSCRA